MKAPSREPTPLEASAPLCLEALPSARRFAVQRLAEDFCDAPDDVLETMVNPITPATWSMLVAVQSPFVVGGDTIRERHVRDFLWFHSPLYGNRSAFAVRLRKWWALDRLTTILSQPLRRWLLLKPSAHHYSIILAMAVDQIEMMIEWAFASASGSKSNHVPFATLEAHLIHRFATTYGWTPERTRHAPLAQLFQFDRCIARRNGESVVAPEQEALLERHLAARNAVLAEARKAAQ